VKKKGNNKHRQQGTTIMVVYLITNNYEQFISIDFNVTKDTIPNFVSKLAQRIFSY
jgi:hypothetical protein